MVEINFPTDRQTSEKVQRSFDLGIYILKPQIKLISAKDLEVVFVIQ